MVSAAGPFRLPAFCRDASIASPQNPACDTMKANVYALARVQFVTEKDKESRIHSDLTTLCQHHEQSRQEAQHRLKTQKAARRWSIALVLAAFVVSVVSFILVVVYVDEQLLLRVKVMIH